MRNFRNYLGMRRNSGYFTGVAKALQPINGNKAKTLARKFV